MLTDSLESGRSLTNEVWRTFLIAMAFALLAEALLCLPGRREVPSSTSAKRPVEMEQTV